MKKIKKIFYVCFIALFMVMFLGSCGGKTKASNGLQLLSFETEKTKMLSYNNDINFVNNTEKEVERVENKNVKAIATVKNENRYSFIDLVLYL